MSFEFFHGSRSFSRADIEVALAIVQGNHGTLQSRGGFHLLGDRSNELVLVFDDCIDRVRYFVRDVLHSKHDLTHRVGGNLSGFGEVAAECCVDSITQPREKVEQALDACLDVFLDGVLQVDDSLLGVAEGGKETVYEWPREVDDGVDDGTNTCHRYAQGVGDFLVFEECVDDRHEHLGHETQESGGCDCRAYQLEAIGPQLARLLQESARLLGFFAYVLRRHRRFLGCFGYFLGCSCCIREFFGHDLDCVS